MNRVLKECDKTKEFFKIVENFITSEFQQLEVIKIVWSFVEPTRFNGQSALPLKIYKLPPSVRDLFQKDFHAEISQDAWKNANKSQKIQLIWRALRTCGVSLDENNKTQIDASGKVMIFLNKPDIDASFYSDEILKFGSSGAFKALSKTLGYILEREQSKTVKS